MKILLTGATGFIGRELALRLFKEGNVLTVLSRSARSASQRLGLPCEAVQCDLLRGPPPREAFQGVDAIVHLAGEPVADRRWTTSRKKAIRESRWIGTRHLIEGMKAAGTPLPTVFVSTSAIGYYGDRGEEILTETSAPGPEGDFLAEVCQGWEAEARRAEGPGTRVAILRLGIVLGKGGGALERMLPPFGLGLGAKLGSGGQWMSWIHLDDVVEAFCLALRDPRLRGPVNVVAPDPVTNQEFTQALAHGLGKRAWLVAPSPLLRLGLGEMAGALLASARVQPRALESLGFEFRYPTLRPALAQLLGSAHREDLMDQENWNDFWNDRWQRGDTRWHQSEPEPALARAFAGVTPRRVLVPLCGKSLDLKWLLAQGHEVIGIELSELAVRSFFTENAIPFEEGRSGPFRTFRGGRIQILNGNFFDLDPTHPPEGLAPIDAVYDRAALVALPRETRRQYCARMVQLLRATAKPDGFKFLEVVIERETGDESGPPFSVPESEINALYGSQFEILPVSRESVAPERSGIMTECVYEFRWRSKSRSSGGPASLRG